MTYPRGVRLAAFLLLRFNICSQLHSYLFSNGAWRVISFSPWVCLQHQRIRCVSRGSCDNHTLHFLLFADLGMFSCAPYFILTVSFVATIHNSESAAVCHCVTFLWNRVVFVVIQLLAGRPPIQRSVEFWDIGGNPDAALARGMFYEASTVAGVLLVYDVSNRR